MFHNCISDLETISKISTFEPSITSVCFGIMHTAFSVGRLQQNRIAQKIDDLFLSQRKFCQKVCFAYTLLHATVIYKKQNLENI